MAGIYNRGKYGATACFSAGALMEDSDEELTEEEDAPVPVVEHACSQQTVLVDPAAEGAESFVAPAEIPIDAPTAGFGLRPPHLRLPRMVEQPSIDAYAVVKKKDDRIDFFGMFAQKQVQGCEFLGWVTPTEAQRANMLRAIGHFGTHHATERSWDRIPLGPVALSSCLDREHKAMLTERVVIIVQGAGQVDLDWKESHVISWKAQCCTRVSGVLEGICSSSTANMIEDCLSKAHIIDPKGEAMAGAGHAEDEDEDVGVLSDKGEQTITNAFKTAFLAGLHGGTAQVFRVQSLKAVTMVGTLVFHDNGCILSTVLPNKGKCQKHVKKSPHLEKPGRRR
jgi:hypothetical protein